MKRRRAAMALFVGAVALASGCSGERHAALPAAPVAPLPAVTPGTLVARLDGSAWSGFASASVGDFLTAGALKIHAFGTDYWISLAIPKDSSVGAVCTLHGDPSSLGAVLIPGQPHDGYITTDPPYTGTVTIMAIDATHVAGEFHFDAIGDRGVIHVTEGGFDAPIVSDSLAAVWASAISTP